MKETNQNPALLKLDSAFLLSILIDELLGHYELLTEGLEDAVEAMEERALTDSSDALLEDLLHLKRVVFAVYRLASQHRAPLEAFLRPDFSLVGGDVIEPYFRDLDVRLGRLLDALEAAKESVNGSIDLYVSQVAHRTTDIMKILTIVSVTLLPATVILGFFGTNFESPQIGTIGGFMVMVGLVVLTTGEPLSSSSTGGGLVARQRDRRRRPPSGEVAAGNESMLTITSMRGMGCAFAAPGKPPVVGGCIGFSGQGMDHCTEPQGVTNMSQDRFDALSRSLADPTSRRSLLTILGVGAAGAAVTAAGLNEALAKKKNKGNVNTTFENQLTNLPVRGKGRKGTFKGHVDIVRFEEGGATGIQAVGLLTGKVTGDAKKTGKDAKKTKNVRNKEVVLPVTFSTQTAEVQSQVICEILNLVLGPIDLNLLGLRLRTNTIRIRLTADSQGGLLGSLLCGLASPIGGSPLDQIVNLLNQILGLLGGL